MSIEAMKQALEAIKLYFSSISFSEQDYAEGYLLESRKALCQAIEQAEQAQPVEEFKSPGKRWEDGDDHDPRSEALYAFIADTDYEHCGDSFCFKSGGDGDNGETLMFILDCWFAQQRTAPPAERKLEDSLAPPRHPWLGLTDEEVEYLASEVDWSSEHAPWNFNRRIETKLKEKNT